jgi:hypothetical protein
MTATHLTSGGDASNSTSYTTGSITPSANKLILAVVTSTQSAVPNAPAVSSLTGNGLTWVQVLDSGSADARWRVFVFRAMGASPSAGAVTISMGGTSTNCTWSIAEYDGVDTTGTDGSGAIGQTVMGAWLSSVTSFPANFATSPTNPCVGGAVVNSAEAPGGGTGWSVVGSTTTTTPNVGLAQLFASTGQDVAATLTAAASGRAFGIELVPASAGVGGPLDIAGSGTLAMTGQKVASGSIALTGTSAVAETATTSRTGTLPLAGTGATAAAGAKHATGGPFDLAAAGAFGVTAHKTAQGVVLVTGTGTLALAGGPPGVVGGPLNVAGVGTLSFTAVRTSSGALTLAGAGSSSLAGLKRAVGAFPVSGTGAVALAGQKRTGAALGMAGSGTLALAGAKVASGTLDLLGPSSLVLFGTQGQPSTAPAGVGWADMIASDSIAELLDAAGWAQPQASSGWASLTP